MLSDDPTGLPDVPIRPAGSVSRGFRARGVTTVHGAARYVRDLPYGRPDDRTEPLAVLDEGVGTCSTKHALLSRLCDEQGLETVRLTLGIYEMRERNTPGVGDVLAAHGLTTLPEAHCYLRHDDARFDFTGAAGDGAPIERFLHEEPIRPEQIASYKSARHREFLATWADRRDLERTVEELWTIREACIERLAAADHA